MGTSDHVGFRSPTFSQKSAKNRTLPSWTHEVGMLKLQKWATRWPGRHVVESSQQSPILSVLGVLCGYTAVLLVLLVDEVVGHAGDVVADHARERVLFRLFPVASRIIYRFLHPELEQ